MRGLDEVGAARLLVWAQADLVIQAKRPADFFAYKGADGFAREAAYELTDEVAESQRVVTGLGAGRPKRLLDFERFDDRAEIEQGTWRRGIAHRNARSVIQDPADQDPFLSGLGKLRPIVGHRFVEIEQPAIHQHVGTQSAHALGDGHHANDGVTFPRPGTRAVLVPTPKVDHGFSIDAYGDGSADLVAAGEVLQQDVPDCGKPWIVGSVHSDSGGKLRITVAHNRHVRFPGCRIRARRRPRRSGRRQMGLDPPRAPCDCSSS